MYELFLETESAQYCRNYAAKNPGVEVDQLLGRVYELTTTSKYAGVIRNSDWFVTKCLNGDSHKKLRLVNSFSFEATREGSDFWVRVCVQGKP